MKKLINQILKFGVVGGIAFAIDYGILFLLAKVIGLNELISAAISFIISLMISIFTWEINIWCFLNSVSIYAYVLYSFGCKSIET